MSGCQLSFLRIDTRVVGKAVDGPLTSIVVLDAIPIFDAGQFCKVAQVPTNGINTNASCVVDDDC